MSSGFRLDKRGEKSRQSRALSTLRLPNNVKTNRSKALGMHACLAVHAPCHTDINQIDRVPANRFRPLTRLEVLSTFVIEQRPYGLAAALSK